MVLKGFFRNALFITLIGSSHSVFALGLSIPFQSAADIGDGRAGNAAVVRDASTNYFNPAGLVLFEHPQYVISEVAVLAHNTFQGVMSNPGLGQLTYEQGGVATTPSGTVPAIHYVKPLTKDLAIGVSFVVPSGLGFDYSNLSLIRYEVVSTAQSSPSLTPSIAYKITPHLSVGIGPDALFTYARQTVMVRTQPLTPHDSEVVNTASGIDFGWHGGLLYQFTPHTRIGLGYHSQVIVHIFGSSRFYSSGTLLPSFASNRFRATVPLASLTNLSVYHQMNCCWALLGSVEYMNWRIYKTDHAYNVGSPIGPVNVVSPRNFRDTWYYALGSSYKLADNFLVRGGVDYARGATNTANRKISVTDGSEIDINAGFHYQVNPTLGFDMGSNYGFINTVTVRDFNTRSGNFLAGRMHGTGVTLGGQVTWDVV